MSPPRPHATSSRFLALLGTLGMLLVLVPPTAASASDLPRPVERFGSSPAAAHWQVAQFRAAIARADRAERPWDGSVAGCRAGSRTATELDAVVDLVNLHRHLVGVPALLGTDGRSNELAQDAALIMEANRALSHDPPRSWACWSRDGDEGAGTSNLHYGTGLWGQVLGYMVDAGAGNTAVGHRQWLLDPSRARIGVGATSRAAAIRVIDVPTRGDNRARAVPWPPAGPSPGLLVPRRWSLSLRGVDADLSGATVRVTRGGSALPITVHGDVSGYGGFRTISWEMRDSDIAAAVAPGPRTTTFRVTVGNIRVGGATRSLSYDVRVVPDRFGDDDGGTFEADAVVLAAGGVAAGCNTAGTRFCPNQSLTRGQLAAMLARALDLPPTRRDWFVDDDRSPFEDDINRLAEAGITRGCTSAGTRYCPDRPITRAEMATFFSRSFSLPRASRDWFSDDRSSPHQDAINRFREARITLGCNPPGNTRFCPEDNVTRGQIAAFFVRSDLVTLPR